MRERTQCAVRVRSDESSDHLAQSEQGAQRLIDEGNGFEDEGRREEALARYEAAIRLSPNLARAHLNRGNMLQSGGDVEGALEAFATAIAKDPGYAAAHYNMGMAYLRSGRPGEAHAAFKSALALRPDLADAEVGLGCASEELGQLDAAAESYRRALAIHPGYAEVHANLGNVLSVEGQHEAALASYRRAVEIKPEVAEVHLNVGKTLQDLRRPEEAAASYRCAIEINPNLAVAHSNLGNAMMELARFDDAVASYQRALEIDPRYAEVHCHLGNALRGMGQLKAAATSYRQAVEMRDDFAEAHSNLGNVLADLGQLNDALASHCLALKMRPGLGEAHFNLGCTLQKLGRLDEAKVSFHRALQIKPDLSNAHGCLLFCLSHQQGLGAEALFAEHCRFGEQFESPVRASWPRHRNLRDPARCLQVGFVSADFRDHAVACFIEPLLVQLAECTTLSLHAYYNHPIEDRVSARLRRHFKHWNYVVGMTDAALAERIVNDGIDILIDLSGHTGGNRLLAFARKPAPVQASWIGYPGTTGLSAMDYYLADRYFLPPGKFDRQFTEKLVYLPALAPFLPDKSAPPVNALPALSNGYVTFGSFNRMTKLRPSVIALWSRLLRALPNARMLLGAMPSDTSSNPLIEWFAREGIGRERLIFHPRRDILAYLALHHQVDLCLDTFPYTGGTTTNYALWMGVPTLTLAGQTAPGRQGAANLGHVGLEGFVAEDAEDFQAKGLHWANHVAELAEIRAELRGRWERSPIRKPEVIAAGVERALRVMWQRWCAGLPAESFDASAPADD